VWLLHDQELLARVNAKDGKGYTAYAMTGDKKLRRLLIKAGGN